MVKFLTLACIFATLAAAAVIGGGAQSAPPQPPLGASAVDCSTLIYDLMDCMEFLIVGGTETTPQKSCCVGFETVLETDADCICYALSNSGSLGLDVNMTRAQALSSDCGVSVDPIAACHVSASPIASPIGPPANPPTLPPPAVTPSGIAASPRLSSIAGAPDSDAPAPGPGKSAATAISATFSTLLLISLLLFFA